MWRHPSYYTKLKKENRLTQKRKYDIENNNEKIQNKISGHGDRSSGNNSIRKRTND